MTRLAMVTCHDLPDWEVDDTPLFQALDHRGAEHRLVSWDDPEVDWGSFDAALIRTTWDYADQIREFLDWSHRAADATRLFHGPSVLEWNLDKSYLRDLRDRDVPITESEFLDAGSALDLAALCARRGWSRAFLKPMVGASARETLPVRAEPESLRDGQAHLDRLLENEGMIVQPFLESVMTEGEYSIVFVDGEATHGVRKVPVPGDYRVQDDYGAHDEPWTFGPADLRLAENTLEQCVAALGTTADALLYARVDFLRDDASELRVNEVELVEPSMFFRHGPGAADRLAAALIRRTRELS